MPIFESASEPSYVLIGEVVPKSLAPGDDCLVLFCGAQVARYAEDLRPLFEFVADGRTRSELSAFLSNGGAPAGALADLVTQRVVLELPPNAAEADLLGALSLVRIEPLCVPVPDHDTGGLVLVAANVEASSGTLVDPAVCVAMWESAATDDLASSARQAAQRLGITPDEAARRILWSLNEMLPKRYARIELVPDDAHRRRRWSATRAVLAKVATRRGPR